MSTDDERTRRVLIVTFTPLDTVTNDPGCNWYFYWRTAVTRYHKLNTEEGEDYRIRLWVMHVPLTWDEDTIASVVQMLYVDCDPESAGESPEMDSGRVQR